MADEVGMTAYLKPELDRRAVEDAGRELEERIGEAARLKPTTDMRETGMATGGGGGGGIGIPGFGGVRGAAMGAGRLAGQVALTRAARGLGIPATLTSGTLFGGGRGGGGGGGGGSVTELLEAQLEVQQEILEEIESPAGGMRLGTSGPGGDGGGNNIIPIVNPGRLLGRLGGAASGLGRMGGRLAGGALSMMMFGGMGVRTAGPGEEERLMPGGPDDPIGQMFGDALTQPIQDLMNLSEEDFGIPEELNIETPEDWPPEIEGMDSLEGFEWPDIPDVGEELESLDWPDIPDLPDDVDDFDWPDIPDLPDPLANFEWPTLKAPEWARKLFNLNETGSPDDSTAGQPLTGGGRAPPRTGPGGQGGPIDLSIDQNLNIDPANLDAVEREVNRAIQDAIDEFNRRIGERFNIKI